MKRSTERILTTHCGSLARPHDLLELMQAKETGQPYDYEGFARRVRSAVADIVQKQVEHGVDSVTSVISLSTRNSLPSGLCTTPG